MDESNTVPLTDACMRTPTTTTQRAPGPPGSLRHELPAGLVHENPRGIFHVLDVRHVRPQGLHRELPRVDLAAARPGRLDFVRRERPQRGPGRLLGDVRERD